MGGKWENLVGRVFGHWTVQSFDKSVGNRRYWWATCDCCGRSFSKATTRLKEMARIGGTCKQYGHTLQDLAGMRFGRLVVQGRAEDNPKFPGHAVWKCLCDCGCTREAYSNHLRRGVTRSCGCLSREVAYKRSYKHGHGSARLGISPEYHVWRLMIQRCVNPNAAGYEHYGGRGITVCDRWRKDFRSFLSDAGPRPANMQLDRIDPDGNYEPGNVRWATTKEQAANKRTSLPRVEAMRSRIRELEATNSAMAALLACAVAFAKAKGGK